MELTTSRKVFLGLTIIGSPVGFLLGWIVLMSQAGQGPDSGWFISHALLLGGVILLFPAVLGLRLLLGTHAPGIADAIMALTLLGAVALVGQFTIDLAVGTLASSQSEMSELLRRVSAAPGIAIPFHVIGPIAMYGGLLTIIIFLFTRRLIPTWAGLIAVISIVAVGAGAFSNNPVITLIGFTGMTISFAPIGWQLLRHNNI